MTGVDPAARRVDTDAGSYDADFVVVALGADYDFAATPGFEQGGHEYYSLAGAERLRDALADFKGGRVLVSVLGQPFKCPPAPFEGSFLLHEHFTQQGIRDSVEMATTFPMARPVPVTGEVSQMFRDGLAARRHQGAARAPRHRHRPGDTDGPAGDRRDAALRPVRRHPDPPGARPRSRRLVSWSNNWVPVDQSNLRTPFPGVYALGDVCTGPRNVPKAGIFAEAAARVVADDIAAAIAGDRSARRHTRPRASATPSSAAGSSARSRSTSSAATRRPPSATTPRSSSLPRSSSSARSGARAGSVSTEAPTARPCRRSPVEARSVNHGSEEERARPGRESRRAQPVTCAGGSGADLTFLMGKSRLTFLPGKEGHGSKRIASGGTRRARRRSSATAFACRRDRTSPLVLVGAGRGLDRARLRHGSPTHMAHRGGDADVRRGARVCRPARCERASPHHSLSVSEELAGHQTFVLVIGGLIALACVTIAGSLAVSADGARHPTTIASTSSR